MKTQKLRIVHVTIDTLEKGSTAAIEATQSLVEDLAWGEPPYIVTKMIVARQAKNRALLAIRDFFCAVTDLINDINA